MLYSVSQILCCHMHSRYYISKTNRRISFEWALIENETDTPEAAHELGKLIQGLVCHVNLIPLNTTEAYDGKPTSNARMEQFISILVSDFLLLFIILY